MILESHVLLLSQLGRYRAIVEGPEDKDLRPLGSAKNCGDLSPGNTLDLSVGRKMETGTDTFS